MQAKFTKAILLGYSGHGYVVAEAALKSGVKIIGYAEGQPLSNNPFQLAYLGDETQSDFDWQACPTYILGVGSNVIRAKMAQRVQLQGGQCLTIIHPTASVAEDIQIGKGSFIARNAAVNPLVKMGENVVVNTSSSIDHECIIGHNVHIAPGAVLAGNVRVADGAFIGANGVVKEGISIGENAMIGAGSVVIKNVSANAVMVGNPAKKIN